MDFFGLNINQGKKEPTYDSIAKNDDGNWVVFGISKSRVFESYEEAEAFLEKNSCK